MLQHSGSAVMDEEGPGAGGEDQGLMEAANTRAVQVEALLKSNKHAAALAKALEDPPVTGKREVKDRNLETVKSVLTAISDSNIDAVVEDLSVESCDVLMKYTYALLGQTWNSASMLKWHAKLVEKAGLGSVVRALVDRKTVGGTLVAPPPTT